jgi:hypothetical protein
MRRIALLFALMLLCAPAGVAHAWAEPPADDDARLSRFVPLARAAWPGSPCSGREIVHVAADAALAAEAPRLTGRDGDVLEGMAAPAACQVWLAGGLSALEFCTVLVHEFGHLAGRDHTDTPGDVMNGAGDIAHEPCDRDLAPPRRVLLDNELRAMLPPPRGAWRIACGVRRATERRCVARRGVRVRRFLVTETRDALTVVVDR